MISVSYLIRLSLYMDFGNIYKMSDFIAMLTITGNEYVIRVFQWAI